ncbi:MAG TPA: Ku protein [Syntrophomonadaceae bacterium]|nr:Ku protein [Syntrophomonadaceae bacterium]
MRTLWKGAVSFGLVNIPVSMYVATERKDIRFHYLHRECMTPVEYRKYCPRCQKEIAGDEIVRGYEYQKGSYVVINEEEFERIPVENTRTIDILDFVQLEQVDPIYYDKSYYLEAAPGGEKAYTLLTEAMQQTTKVAVARVVIRSKESLAALRVKDRYLLMETLFFPDEIRSPLSLNNGLEQSRLHDNELKMAVSLVENLSTEFDPSKYQNQYRQALWEIIEAKIAGQEIVNPQPAPESGKVVDLMEALRTSVKLAEENRQPAARQSKKKKSRVSKTGS